MNNATCRDGIASEFSPSTPYAKGKWVWHNGVLYEFTSAHAAGAWTGTDVTSVVIGDEVNELKSASEALDTAAKKEQANKTAGLYNLIDRESLYNLADVYLNSTGGRAYGQNYLVTHYIKVKPLTAYIGQNITTSTSVYLAEYDKDFNVVATAVGNSINGVAYTTGSTTEYMRLTIQKNLLSGATLTEGSEGYDRDPLIQPYDLGYYEFNNKRLSANAFYTGIRTKGLPFNLVETYDHTSVSSNKAIDTTTTNYSLSQIIGIPDSVSKISVYARKSTDSRANIVFLSADSLTGANIVEVYGFTNHGTEYEDEFTVPTGAKYFSVAMKRNSTLNNVIAVYASAYDPTATETKITTMATAIAEEEVAPYDGRLDTLEGFKTDISDFVVDKSKNRLDASAVTANKIIWKNGNIQDNSSYSITDYIAVTPGDTVSLYQPQEGSGYVKRTARSFAAFDASKSLVSSEGSDSPGSDITAGAHTYYIRLTATKSHVASGSMIFLNDTTTPTVYYPYYPTTEQYVAKPAFIGEGMGPIPSKNQYGVMAQAAEFTTGQTITACQNIDNKKNDIITFYAEIGTFSAVKVGHGYNMAYGSYVVVDGANLTTYFGASQYFQHAHGLTISHYLYIEIKHGNTGRADITIRTDGGEYTVAAASIAWDGCKGDVFATSDGSTLANAVIACTFNDFQENVFVFGDSYLNTADTARWSYYLVANGYTKNALFGYGGATSSAQKTVFDNVLRLAKPNYLVWALGMNDADSSSAINATYKTVLDAVIAKCEQKGITPILATIPNTPTANHTYKNAYVKSLGYRYVDFAAAVGASEAGATWWSGMLSNDNTHPTALGAKALYARFAADVPEALKR